MAQFSSSVFERKLRERIKDEIDRLTGVLTLGHAVNDYAQYRSIAGEISALGRVLTYCDDTNDDLEKTM